MPGLCDSDQRLVEISAVVMLAVWLRRSLPNPFQADAASLKPYACALKLCQQVGYRLGAGSMATEDTIVTGTKYCQSVVPRDSGDGFDSSTGTAMGVLRCTEATPDAATNR